MMYQGVSNQKKEPWTLIYRSWSLGTNKQNHLKWALDHLFQDNIYKFKIGLMTNPRMYAEKFA